MPRSTPWEKSQIAAGSVPQSAVCKALFAEIGDFCNGEDIICRANNATCMRQKPYGQVAVCACNADHIPVYQEYLGYHECVPRLKTNNFVCNHCANTGGECYDKHGDGNQVGCLCPPSRTAPRIDRDKSHHLDYQESCSEHLIKVNCSKDVINICYKPERILGMDLLENNAIAFISGQAGGGSFKYAANTSQCQLRVTNVADSGLEFCIQLYVKRNDQLPCGFLRVAYTTLTHYEGYLEIWRDPTMWQPNKDLLFGIDCKMKPTETVNEGHVFNRRIDNWMPKNEANQALSHRFVDVDFHFINSYGLPINQAKFSEAVGLEARLSDSRGKNKKKDKESLECSYSLSCRAYASLNRKLYR
ncbi:hypothetical protein Ciccas_005104 [Cichlidogyrus casuarinus]|uniref:Uncharacterized protein n=1 Tax=Cichlidogyrus casuarinus TaxID=1844966 RepID=A0ABD2QA23_9PLAT